MISFLLDIFAGHCEVVNLLLSKGIPVDPDSFVGTPLNAAARNRQEKIVKILLEHGANVICLILFSSM